LDAQANEHPGAGYQTVERRPLGTKWLLRTLTISRQKASDIKKKYACGPAFRKNPRSEYLGLLGHFRFGTLTRDTGLELKSYQAVPTGYSWNEDIIRNCSTV
jgi:hypothetical protein